MYKSKCVTAIIVSAALLLASCAPKAEDFLLPIATPTPSTSVDTVTGTPSPSPASSAEEALPFLPDVFLTELKSTIENPPAITFSTVLYAEGFDEVLLDGVIAAPAVSIYADELYTYPVFPRSLSVPAMEYEWKPDALKQIEVYSASDSVNPIRTIPLQGLDGLRISVLPGGITVDADGIFLLLTASASQADGTVDYTNRTRGLYHFGFDGKLLASQPFTMPQSNMPMRLLRADGTCYVLMHDMTGPKIKYNMTEAERIIDTAQRISHRILCTIDPETESFVPVARTGMENTALLGILAYKDGRLLCLDKVVRKTGDAAAPALQASLFNPVDGTSEVLSYVYCSDGDTVDAPMAYDASLDSLFFFQGKELLAWRLGTAAPLQRLMKISKTTNYIDLYAINGSLMLAETTGRTERLTDFMLPDATPLTPDNADSIAYAVRGAGTKLTVLTSAYSKQSFLSYDSTGYRSFSYLEDYYDSKNLPGIGLNPIFLGAEQIPNADSVAHADLLSYHDALAKKLLAGDDDFDIFLLGGSNYNFNLPLINSVIESDYIRPLDGLGLEPFYDAMLPGIKELCTVNGKLVLVPVHLGLPALSISKDIMAEAGLRPNGVPRTAVDFASYLDNQKEKFTDLPYMMVGNYIVSDMLNMMMRQYAIQFFENESQTQAAWDALIRLLDACLANAGTDVEKYGNTAISALLYGTVIGAGPDGPKLIHPQPLLTPDAKYPLAEAMFIGVNPNSKNLDAVAEFLRVFLRRDYYEFAAEQEKFPAKFDKILAYQNVGTALYDIPVLDAATYPDFAVYKEMLANASRGVPSDWDYQNLADYIDGTLSAAEWKELVDRELEFLRDE